MIKFKSEVEMFGVKLKPKYARTKYTVIDSAQREIRKAQRLHKSYNVSAIILVYEKLNNDTWIKIDTVEVEKL